MDRRPVVVVLAPYVEGYYFGSLMAAIARATAAAHGQVVAVQTLDAGSEPADMVATWDFRHPVAQDYASAFVVIINAVEQQYLTPLVESGKPVVTIGHEYPGLACPVVLPDNRAGVREAVEHLVRHGHRRIAFAGSLREQDPAKRYQAYVETLAAQGIDPDPRLFFDTENNHESGGDHAARSMIAAGLPCTAVVAATDLNAMGIMRTLESNGCALPQDMAVVGFDDMEMAPYLSPSLSSVRQPFESIGHRAVSLLLRQLDGEDVATERHYVATSFVARESCGCSGPTALPVVTADARSQGESPDRLIAGLIDRLTTTLLPGTEMVDLADRAVLAGATEEIASALDTVVAGAPAPDGMRVRQSLDALYRLRPRPESLLEIVAAVRDYGRCAAAFHAAAGSGTSETETMLRVEECTHDMILGLSQSQARGLLSNTIYVHNTMDTQYEVSMGLLRSHEEDPRDLRWLRCTTMRAGCLGLWRDGVAPAGAPVLTIAGTFTRDGLAPALPEGDRDVGAFPPREMLALAGEAPEDVVFVARVKINESDWGMLATVGAIEGSTLTGREAANEWAALLTVALNHDAVLAKQREQEARLHRAAFYDSLTGLPNRTLFLDQLRPLLGRSKRRSDYRFGVLVIDLDEFKVINDSLGHATGDQILVKAAERIGAGLREVDTVARFGGDEFAVLLDGIEEWCGIGAVAERLHAALAVPFVIDGQEVVITASIGITLSSTGYECAEDVLRDADIAMNCAKSREKGSHAVFDVEMHARAVNRLQTAADLRRALQEGGLELHYQPIVDLKTGARLAFEALIRWRHPTNGLLSPGAFLQIAEQTGLIVPIGRWTIVEVCRQIREWRQTSPFGERVRVSFNVSNKQFWHDSLLGDLDTALREAGLSPQCLSMEITEGVVMSNVDAACKILQTLHDWGIELHVDDFGTGYSSLEVLHQLPIDALKIDRSFISRLGIDRRSAELVRTIVLMADNLGLDLIAEGIETREQRDRLRQLGAAYGQGYWFSRPVPGDAAGALIWDAGVPAAGVR